jgi:glycerate kinase
MHILIAPNAFKHSLSATAAAEAIRSGLQQSGLSCTLDCFPIGDGGDGTGTILLQKLKGGIEEHPAHDPLGREVHASFGTIEGGRTAIIEMASASGLRLLKKEEADPLNATSFGTGELMLRALDKGARRILLCIGGSATVDGATGILRALGLRFFNASGDLLVNLPRDLAQLGSVDASGLDKRMEQTELIVLCDVDNPLLGDNGAAKIFGPQKGASENDVRHLEAGLQRWCEVVFHQTGKDISAIKHGGAAGGVAAGLFAFLNARLVPGIDYFLEITHFESALEKADLLITGEGSIDAQTLEGKGPLGIARKAREKDRPVIALAGRIAFSENKSFSDYFDAVFPIGRGPMSLEEALKNTEEDLRRTARELGRLLKRMVVDRW